MTNIEIRYTANSEFETRAQGKTLTIVGYAAVFNSRSQNLGGFVEQVDPGTFAKTIQEADVRALWNHNADHVLGRSNSATSTLRLSEDSTGLAYEVDLTDTEFNRGLYETIQRGDVTQSSFGFATINDAWGFTEDNFPLRTLKEVQLFDVSPVTYPAYQDATIGTRALERLAIAKELDFATVVKDLPQAIRGITKPVESTYVDPYIEPNDILVIRGRYNRD